jgi:UDP-GlcNAc:undecaprenyl-phosphate/decaprenyl-phosphate GlcNAc-1-phosphate transferase
MVIIALGTTFLLACISTALLTPPVMRWCTRRGWLAYPGGRRTHARPTPQIGGIAIYAGFVLAVLTTFALERVVPGLVRGPFETLRVWLLLAGATLLVLVMWLDDVRELTPLAKLAGQIAAALLAVGPFLWDPTLYPDLRGAPTEARGIILTAFNLPWFGQVNLYQISPLLAVGATIFWLVALDNTVNFSDGLDGLAAGVSLIAALMLALHALRLDPPQLSVALLPLALAGACAGFLFFNFPPARVFMGDSGAEFLGFTLGVCAIIGGAKLATVLLVLGVPIIEVAWLIITRVRDGRSPAHGGRDHLHHRLLDLGWPARRVLWFYYALSASFGLLGIVSTSPVVKLVALIALIAIVVGVLVYATQRAPRPAE